MCVEFSTLSCGIQHLSLVCKASNLICVYILYDEAGGGKAPVETLEREKSIFCFQFSVQVTQNLTQTLKQWRKKKKSVSVILTVIFR